MRELGRERGGGFCGRGFYQKGLFQDGGGARGRGGGLRGIWWGGGGGSLYREKEAPFR